MKCVDSLCRRIKNKKSEEAEKLEKKENGKRKIE